MNRDSITKLTLIKNDEDVFGEEEKQALQLLHESIIEGDVEELQAVFNPLHVIRGAHISIEQLKYHSANFEQSQIDGVVDLNDDDPSNHTVVYLRILALMSYSMDEILNDIDKFNAVSQQVVH